MSPTRPMPITVNEEWLAMHSAGTLSPFKELVLACQAELRPELNETLGLIDHAGGVLLESAKGEDLSAGFMDALAGRISEQAAAEPAAQVQAAADTPEWMPPALSDYIRRRGIRLKWRASGGGVQRASLGRTRSGERLYLLRAGAGTPLPQHTHAGQEWSLVLSGGYTADGAQYIAGDLHQEDETVMHELRIDNDGPCISLVADEGKLMFANPFLKLIQPLLGI